MFRTCTVKYHEGVSRSIKRKSDYYVVKGGSDEIELEGEEREEGKDQQVGVKRRNGPKVASQYLVLLIVPVSLACTECVYKTLWMLKNFRDIRVSFC